MEENKFTLIIALVIIAAVLVGIGIIIFAANMDTVPEVNQTNTSTVDVNNSTNDTEKISNSNIKSSGSKNQGSSSNSTTEKKPNEEPLPPNNVDSGKNDSNKKNST